MATPQKKEQENVIPFEKGQKQQPKSIEELAAQMAASKSMAKMDFLPGVVDGMFKNLQTMVSVFNEKSKRQAEEDAHLPPEQRRLPELSDLKIIFDAQAAAVQAEIILREEQRKEIMFARATERAKGSDGFDFGGKKKSASSSPKAS
jgi:hypothetical protein